MWKDINGWEGLYEISNSGDVRNKLTGHLVVGDKNSAGYCRVCLYNKNHIPSKQRFFRHRLVAEHFIPNPFNLPEVNHKDTNLDHNYHSNLEWVSKKENELHSRMFGSKEYKPFKVIYKNGDIRTFDCKEDLANEIHVTRRTIANWLHKDNYGFKKHGIISINYI
ncbi:MAG: NUMOD4 domain-containing protein [Candidatus Kurthia intestinigallinarum]